MTDDGCPLSRLDIDRVELSQMREVLASKLERKKMRRGGAAAAAAGGRAAGRVKSATLERHHEGGQRRSHSSMSGRVARWAEARFILMSKVVGILCFF